MSGAGAAARNARLGAAGRIALGAAAALPARINPHALHPARIGIENFDLEGAGARHQFAAHRHPVDQGDDVAGHRVDLFGGLADVEFGADHCDRLLEAGAADGDERSVVLADHGLGGRLVVLVVDLADDFLDDVLDRHDAFAAAIFVDHQRQMDAGRLHLGEQVDGRHRGRHEQDGADDLGGGQRHREVDGGEVEAGGMRLVAGGMGFRMDRGLGHHEGDHVADVHHPDGIIEGVVVDDEARMGGVLEHLQEVAERNVLLHGDDVGPRHHDIVDPAFAQAQDVLEHPAFFRREAGFRALALEQHLQVRSDRGRTPAEHRAQQAVEPGFRIFPHRAAGAPRQPRKIALAGPAGVGIGGHTRLAVGHGTGFKHRGGHTDRECPAWP